VAGWGVWEEGGVGEEGCAVKDDTTAWWTHFGELVALLCERHAGVFRIVCGHLRIQGRIYHGITIENERGIEAFDESIASISSSTS
jgi:hypothetical protein